MLQALLASFGKSAAVGTLLGVIVNTFVNPTTNGGWWLLLIVTVLACVVLNAIYQATANYRWWKQFR